MESTPIHTTRLVLTPLAPSDASEMVEVLASEELYTFTGGEPPTHEELEARYESQVSGPVAGNEEWLNWIVRQEPSQQALGFVQATIVADTADVAWVIAVAHQGRGIATEAATSMGDWLMNQGVRTITAHIHPEHVASQRVAASLGLAASETIDEDGEIIWISADA